jgi:hypothetical protein
VSGQLYSYIIVLRNESSRYVNFTGFFLSAGSALLFAREMVVAGEIILPYILGVVFIAGFLIWNAYAWYRLDKQIYYSKALLIAGLVWMKMPYFQWLIFVLPVLALLEYQAKMAPEIGFAEDHIVFNGLFKRKRAWSEIEHLVLKDGLLTINFRNNKFLQREIDHGENEASEAEFNAWVAARLT